jgi:hypothetical protein
MRTGLRALRPLLLALGVPSLAWAYVAGPAAPAPATATVATLDYQLYAAGLHPLDFSVDIALESDRYVVAVQGQTKGVVDFFVRWISHSVTEGRLVEGRTEPVLSRSLNRFHGTPRRIAIAYHDGMPVATVDPPPQDDDRDPVTPQQMRNTRDATSAVLDLILQVAHGAGCDTRERVFDGRRRFDLVVSDHGVAPVAATQISPYAGDARRCDFTMERIAGFNRRKGEGYDASQPEETVYRTWSLPVLPGLPALPVRLDGEGSLGRFHLYLVAAHLSDRRPNPNLD